MRIRLRRVLVGAKTFVIGSWQPHLRYSGNPRQQGQGLSLRHRPGAPHRRSPARARRSPPPGKIPADKAGNGSAVRLTPPGDQAPDLHFLVAGAGFEPATSGLSAKTAPFNTRHHLAGPIAKAT